MRRHLDLAGLLALMPPSERAEAVGRAIEDFDLSPLADGRVDRLSMGQRQRVRVAMAFLHHPQLVLLDEPGTSLDEPSVAVLNAAVSRLLGRGGAAIWCEPAGSRSDFAFDRRLRLEKGCASCRLKSSARAGRGFRSTWGTASGSDAGAAPVPRPRPDRALLGLPPEHGFDAGFSRPLLRRAMRGIVPDEVRLRRDKTYFDSLLPQGRRRHGGICSGTCCDATSHRGCSESRGRRN